jgi:hypothetical protein
LDHGEEVGGELVVAGSDAAEVLQLREEALDQIPLPVEALAEDAVQHTAVIDARHASRLVGQQRLYNALLEVGQIVSAHADAESGFHPMGKTASL